ncbi:uncharacterized protein SPPG_09558 [Spizellomyces punctatus DAOM BR117]|uniref:Uncharacterized protein n=1 Tax=Spizellomyces punctatus (strain DAOM BR117) TaxID=645134 RepID=A0A0L0H3G2_SPIPD|nr:uncharacterized protein SPPG_09558 [Spizellomyces punctatus DAOM BR117]KNC96005.1 hypothetical protein SPPG_09558 [Spizellomyces punctatus DAOM BR117]|eukprot:XP_016604045.1 hypothetical protein SPPG_09558 [Spizellomyces punctatus DAOM BR117]
MSQVMSLLGNDWPTEGEYEIVKGKSFEQPTRNPWLGLEYKGKFPHQSITGVLRSATDEPAYNAEIDCEQEGESHRYKAKPCGTGQHLSYLLFWDRKRKVFVLEKLISSFEMHPAAMQESHGVSSTAEDNETEMDLDRELDAVFADLDEEDDDEEVDLAADDDGSKPDAVRGYGRKSSVEDFANSHMSSANYVSDEDETDGLISTMETRRSGGDDVTDSDFDSELDAAFEELRQEDGESGELTAANEGNHELEDILENALEDVYKDLCDSHSDGSGDMTEDDPADEAEEEVNKLSGFPQDDSGGDLLHARSRGGPISLSSLEDGSESSGSGSSIDD